MAQRKREIERKYELPGRAADGDTAVLPDLAGVRGVSAVHGKGVMELDACYYDTEDLRLAAHSLTLRRRTGGDDEGWHLKLPLSADEREEIQAPLGTTTVPAELASLLRSRVRDAALVPVVRLRSSRDLSLLVDADGEPLAEVSVDTVRAERIAAGAASTSWTEVEVELADGADPALLDAVEKKLRKAGLTTASSSSKLARALAETHTGAGGTKATAARRMASPRAASTAGDHVLAYVRAQADAIVVQDPAVRRDMPDSVHQLRVASRRLRSVLRTYRAVLDRSVTDPVVGELTWLATELGVERDQEVLAERLRNEIDTVPGTLLLGPVRARWRAWEAAGRAAARLRTMAVLDSDRYLALLDRLDALLMDPPLRASADEEPFRVLPAAILSDYGRLARRVGHALTLTPGEERNRAFHDCRKAAKRVRYAAEAATPALGRPARRFARRIKALQVLLGDHHDSVVTRAALRTLAVSAHLAGETAFTWGLLYGREEERAARCERELPTAWQRASKEKLRSALAG